MRNIRNSCNCVKQCPCYPDCDQMMQDGQLMQPGMQTRPGMQTQPGMEMRPGMQTMPGMQVRPDDQIRWEEQMLSELEEMQRMEERSAIAGYDDNLLMDEDERDWQKLKEMYPDMAKIIQAEVETVCNNLEYEGSMMFDSMPDKERIRRMTADIFEKVKNRYPVEEEADQDDMLTMNREGRRRYPPNQNWLNDFIQVLLFQEMHRRRCRNRRCHR